ncbi:hypothetical protein WJX74_005499 [Apatococcus lobatus]|uniref:RNA-binding S4 domain-containing protein n=1 Tax=Apatococcus lobatus TaxID=904363 RepID=A0AAW1RI64_9CHLO
MISCQHPLKPDRLCLWSKADLLGLSSHATFAARAKDDLLKGVDPEYREDIARILDLADQAQATWTTVFTDFYAPPVVAAALIALRKLADVTAVPLGGYPQAERCRLCLGHADALTGAAADPAELGGVSAMEVSGNFMFDPITHRDILGACCTGTGVVRGKIGDILVHGEQGAQMLVVPELVPHFQMFLTQVRSVPVTTKAVDLSELKIRAPKVQELRSVEASMRLDSVASAGFRVSRSQMSDLCAKGDVKVNWKPMKASRDVQEGDTISCAGKGRLEIRSVSVTKKGKYAVEMVRLL